MSKVEKSFSSEKFEVRQLVTVDFHNKRLDRFVMRYISSMSRENIKRKIVIGEIYIEGRTAKHKPNTKIKQGDTVIITTFRRDMEDDYWQGEVIQKEKPQTVFEDENILVAYKPPFISTHPTGKHLFDCLTVFFEQDGRRKLYSVHRLDRETSGVLLMAKNTEAASFYTRAFEDKIPQKIYFFIAEKRKENSFPFRAYERLGYEPNFIPSVVVHCYPEGSSNGKRSETYFDTITEEKGYLIGLAAPITGRQHQIRAHAAHHGLPLVGDKIYHDHSIFTRYKDNEAKPEDFEKMQLHRHALHAFALKVPAMKKGFHIFQSPLPKDLNDWLESKGFMLSKIEKVLNEKVENYFSD